MGSGCENNNGDVMAETKEILKGKKNYKIAAVVIALLVLVASPFIAQFIADKYTNAALKKTLAGFQGACYATFEDSKYNLLSRHLLVNNLSVICGEEAAAVFGQIDFARIVANKPIPSNVSAEFTSSIINVNARIFGDYGKTLTELGYSSVPVSGQVAYVYAPQSKQFKVDKFIFTAEGIGDFALEFTLDNITGKNAALIAEKVYNSKLTAIWSSFTDKGLTEKVLTRYSKTIDSSVNNAKARALHGIERRIANKYKDNAIVREQLVQIYRFIQAPSILIVKSDPERPASIHSIVNSVNYTGWRTMLTSLERFPLNIYSN